MSQWGTKDISNALGVDWEKSRNASMIDMKIAHLCEKMVHARTFCRFSLPSSLITLMSISTKGGVRSMTCIGYIGLVEQ